jgi:dihydroxyacetone kinase-like predicted kinase
MKVQHEHIVDIQTKTSELFGKGKKHGIVVISPGEGLADVLKSLGVDYTVRGGQTMNPSLKDLYEAKVTWNRTRSLSCQQPQYYTHGQRGGQRCS